MNYCLISSRLIVNDSWDYRAITKYQDHLIGLKIYDGDRNENATNLHIQLSKSNGLLRPSFLFTFLPHYQKI